MRKTHDTKFQLNRTKVGTKTENGRILGLSGNKFDYDFYTDVKIGQSSLKLLSVVDFSDR